MRKTYLLALLMMLTGLTGCGYEFNPIPTMAESDSLEGGFPLVSGFDSSGEAYFTKDMQWIVFQAIPNGQTHYQMYLAQVKYEDVPVRREGSILYASPKQVMEKRIAGIGLPIRISPEDSRNTCGFFSPDGLSIIFASTAGKEDPNEPQSGYQRDGSGYRWIYSPGMDIYRADGWQGAVALAEPGKISDLAKHRITDNAFYDAECAFSPDGRSIIFTSNRDGDLELYAMRADGENVVRLTKTRGYDGGAFISPDGKHVVYRSDRKKKDMLEIYTADLQFDAVGNITGMTNDRRLTHEADIINWGPFWHPDGEHIIYGTSRHGHENYELYLMRADGMRKTRITFANGADVLPAFSPDGKYLVWSSKRAGAQSQVYIARFKFPKGT